VADGRARHAQHDLDLVAAWAAGEATGAELERAERLLDACDLCVDTARDLRAITLGLQELPAVNSMTAFPPAPRDFRLTPEQAARLRPSVPLVRWADRFAAAVAAFGRPVGASLATLGLVGVLVGAASLGFLGGSNPFLGSRSTAATSAPMAAQDNASAAPAPGADGGAPGNVPLATKAASEGTALGAAATGAARGSAGGPPAASAAAASTAPPGPSTRTSSAAPEPEPATWLLVASVVALVGGIGLIVISTRRG
jgi:hypothetical protein